MRKNADKKSLLSIIGIIEVFSAPIKSIQSTDHTKIFDSTEMINRDDRLAFRCLCLKVWLTGKMAAF